MFNFRLTTYVVLSPVIHRTMLQKRTYELFEKCNPLEQIDSDYFPIYGVRLNTFNGGQVSHIVFLSFFYAYFAKIWCNCLSKFFMYLS